MGVVNQKAELLTAVGVGLSEGAQAAKTTSHLKRRLTLALLLATAAIAVGAIGTCWTTGRFQVSTDDAYVAADSTAVAPKISGYIKDVLIADNQAVKAGQILAKIYDSDFKTALAQANVAAAAVDVGNLKAQIEQQDQTIAAARSNISADQANQLYAQQDHQRYADLVKTGYGTLKKVQL